MKALQSILTAGVFAALALCSCSKDIRPAAGNNNGEVKRVQFVVDDLIDDSQGEAIATKTILDGTTFTWAVTDTVGIYPDKGSQIYFAMTSGAGTNTAVFDGGGWAFRGGSTYYSYYPFISDFHLDRTNIPVHFDGQVQNGPTNFEHFGEYDFLYTDPVQEKENAISFQYHHLICVMKFKVTLPAGTYRQLTVTAPEPVFVQKGHFNLISDSPAVIGDEFSKEHSIALNGIAVDGEQQIEIYLVSAPFDLTGKDMIVSVFDSEGKQYDIVKPMTKAYVPFKIYSITLTDWIENKEIIHVKGITLDKEVASIRKDESKTLTVTVFPSEADDKSVAWSIGDQSIASVNQNGVVTGLKEGSTTVFAESKDGGYKAQCQVLVYTDGNNEKPDIGGEWKWD